MDRFRSAKRAEAGETLIEVLISSALMAIVVVAIIGGVTTVVLGSSVHRKQADGNTVLVAAMEQVKSPDTARVCAANDGSHPYAAASPGLPSDVTITSIEYQKTGSPTVTWSEDWATYCNLEDSHPLTLQLITLQFATTDDTVFSELSFVKGKY